MSGRIQMIERTSDSVYCVTLEDTKGIVLGKFAFTVGQDDLEVVSWSESFRTYMGPQPWHLSALFSAVLAFHHAQELELPSAH
jgi:hypothetical protein